MILKNWFKWYGIFGLGLMVGCQSEGPLYPEPMTPEESMASFELDENFEVQLFAAEPHVQDPVEMIFDHHGNIYVVEMPDYPFQPEGAEGKGRIKVLLDTDGDGQIDDSKIFADKIKDATSLQPWKEGFLVTAAPYIYYMKDEDGDLVADTKEILFEGFFNKNQEAQITNLRFNVDNWIYAANHGQAGEVTFKEGEETLSMQGADFRFRLDQDKYERETAPAQFGQALNDWGHRFITQNTIHIQQMVVPFRYLHRHPYMPSTKGVANISDHDLRMYQLTEAPYWRIERSNRRQKKYDEQGLDRIEHIDNHFTGASGGTHYGADLFPEAYQGNIFTGEVMGNLVHRDVITLPSDNPQYIAQRAPTEKTKEFLASKDMWFRPAHFTVGPDGALYIIDYYRQHIETPLSIPEDLKEDMDFMRGSDMGRIYRIVPKGQSVPVIPSLLKENKGTAEDYLTWIQHPNQWFRLHGQRLLLELQDKSVLPKVQTILESHEDAAVRLQALYVFEGMNALSPKLIKIALQDSHPRVREYGLILAEDCSSCLEDMIELTKDEDQRVRMQALLSLGNSDSKKVLSVMAETLNRDVNQPWIRKAVLSSIPGSSLAFWASLEKMNFTSEVTEAKSEFIEDLFYVFGARGENLEKVVAEIQDSSVKTVALLGLSKGVKRSKAKISAELLGEIQSLVGESEEWNTIEKNLTSSK